MSFWYVCKECGYINEVDCIEINIQIKLNSQKAVSCICSECDNRQDIIIEV
ncbi:hypothetical protein HCN_1651 [Helicobacter cinaedi PAGU611]|uniref:Uncharacterized protein n=1 Tax=Helicobacter cinaedi CCUG 18818 = ATCC BAA-847 TaxID=537971 RepID=A0AAI8MNW1_9HELI|nr:hypothetical protein [Helicobacter cinaedi]EFR45698.1 hypothetical protein HCCG_00244 [Helicobacter cinaedi CCUG 18818 = ATCC BAA-847]QOQ91011.1 hypothetical protein HW260_01195 [Helicobacter cinaedi]QOQ95206.1 hypothetical protein HW245_05760 [Helicobacter cinaedi]BAM12835.1 hypothetical protein HCN_1651 [Helicobacter cinaedi PAGU611]BAM33068.1 hypothetical protein HCBAA847_1848 [Helicobacter cinaedi CCUG 18818 = ATCC BAA-847]